METRRGYKLRSSLKKTRTKVPTENKSDEENLETTIDPPPRRVSFAASNYVKPFIDDPEKNTIWDTTYEEQADHIDSTKSDQESLLKTPGMISDVFNSEIYVNQTLVQSKMSNKTIIFNQSSMDLEYTLQNRTLGEIKSALKKGCYTSEQTVMDMEMTCANQSEIDMEFTCQFPNRILTDSNKLKSNTMLNKTNLNESGMEFTCKYDFPQNIITRIPVLEQTEIQNESMEFTCQYNIQKTTPAINLEDKENYKVHSTYQHTNPKLPPHSIVDKENMLVDISTKTVPDHTLWNVPGAMDLNDQSIDVEVVSKNNSVPCSERDEIKNSFVPEKLMVNEKSANIIFYGGVPDAPDLIDINRNAPQKESHGIYIQSDRSGIDNGKHQKSQVHSGIPVASDLINFDTSTTHNVNLQINRSRMQGIKPHSEIYGGISIASDATGPDKSVSQIGQSKANVQINKSVTFDGICVASDVINLDQSVSRKKQPKANIQTNKSVTFGGIFIDLEATNTDQSVSQKELKVNVQTNKNGIEEAKFQKMPTFGGISIACDLTDPDTSELQKENPKIGLQIKKKAIKELKPQSILTYGIPAASDLHNPNMSASQKEYPKANVQSNKSVTFGGISIDLDVTSPEQSASQKELPKVSKSGIEDAQFQKMQTFGGIPIACDLTDSDMSALQKENPKTGPKSKKKGVKEAKPQSILTYGISAASDLLNPNMNVSQKENRKTNVHNNKSGIAGSLEGRSVGSIPIVEDLTSTKVINSSLKYVEQENQQNDLKFEQAELKVAKSLNTQPTEVILTTIQTKFPTFGGIPIAIDQSKLVCDRDDAVEEGMKSLTLDATNQKQKENIPVASTMPALSNRCDGIGAIEIYEDEQSKLIEDDVIPVDLVTCANSMNLNRMSIYTEECSLVDSLPSLNETELQHLSHFNKREEAELPSVREEFSFIQELCSNENQGKIVSYLNQPMNKVVYSEPMRVTKPPLTDCSTSMQASGLNFFNFNSVLSMEDTQQLIQATFSKPSFQCIENEKNESLSNLESGFVNVTEFSVDNVHSDTFKAQTILNDIENNLTKVDFKPINYEEIVSTIKRSQELRKNVEELLQSFRSFNIKAFDLTERNKKVSLGVTSDDLTTSSNSFIETDEENCNEPSMMDSVKSLYDKITEFCDRSNGILKLGHHEGNGYIFKAVYGLVIILVMIHPEDGHVVDVKSECCVKESAKLVRFITNDIKQKLALANLKSYLGQFFDILSLLDYIYITVEYTEKFHVEFLTLQDEHFTLRLLDDFRISFEMLCLKPPIWWTINLKMSPLYKIQPDSVSVHARHGKKVNEEHIRQIARNTEENLHSLKTFIANVIEYFKRTQLMFMSGNRMRT